MAAIPNISSLIEHATLFIQHHPQKLVGHFEWNGQQIWIKRRPFAKRTYWHRMQGLLARLLKLPIFSSTAVVNADSLRQEAERLQHFLQKGMSVPKVLAITETFMLTEDVGIQLQKHLRAMKDSNAVHALLTEAIKLLRQMHQNSLCHGRPFVRDMTLKNGTISVIDLEEDPLTVMQLPQAQARDVWLFLNSAAPFYEKDLDLLQGLFRTYAEGIAQNTLQELKKMVRLLKPLRILLDTPLKSRLGRDVRCAIMANKALERAFVAIDHKARAG